MTKEVSALFDGEQEEREAPSTWQTLKSETSLRQAWGEYQLIGDALRRERRLDADITARVMAELKDEPIVLAPRRKPPSHWQRTAIAMAASVAGVAVVGWLALTREPATRDGAQLVRNEPPPIQVVSAAPVPPKGIEEYMLAHQASAHGLHIQGGTQHIRTVSAIGGR